MLQSLSQDSEGFQSIASLEQHSKDMLQDRLICGISEDCIQQRLLTEWELTFEKAVEIATATEMASNNLIDMKGETPSSDNNVNKVEEETKPPHFQPKREC